jgi:hypothetical protein
MPTPWVPPDPDMPQPLRWDAARTFTAFPIVLKGMSPHDEQPDHAFSIEGKPLAVMMLEAVDASKYLYRGVALGDAAHLDSRSKATLRSLRVPTKEEKAISGTVLRGGLAVGPSGVTYKWAAAERAVITAVAKPPLNASEPWYAVAVPYLPRPTKRYSQFADYRAQAAWAKVPPGGGAVDLAVRAVAGTEYGVFLATDATTGLTVMSPASRLTLA